MADSEDKLYTKEERRKVCESRKLRVNIGQSKVIKCSWYGNGGHNLDWGCERDVVNNK